MASEYILKSHASKTISHEFDRTKKALLIALRKMEIFVDEALETEDGEQIVAGVGAVAEGLVDEEPGVEPLAHVAAVVVGEGDDDGVDEAQVGLGS